MGVGESVAAERVGVDDGGDLHFFGVREGVGGVKDGAMAGAEDCDWEWGWHEGLLLREKSVAMIIPHGREGRHFMTHSSAIPAFLRFNTGSLDGIIKRKEREKSGDNRHEISTF